VVKTIETQIEIDAPAERVWRALTDFDSMPSWNPHITSLEGRAERGARLRVRIEQPGGGGMTFTAKVLSAEPDRELRWLARLPVPGLFSGEHYFEIQPRDDGRLLFTQGELFRGLLVPLLGSVLRKTERGFGEMNRALKELAEAEGASARGH